MRFYVCPGREANAVAATEHVIYSFAGGADGMYPTALISDTAGNLYGTTEFTANYGPGTIFELVKNGSAYTYVVLYTFTDEGFLQAVHLRSTPMGICMERPGRGATTTREASLNLVPTKEAVGR